MGLILYRSSGFCYKTFLAAAPPPLNPRTQEPHVDINIILRLTQQVDDSASIVTRNIVELSS